MSVVSTSPAVHHLTCEQHSSAATTKLPNRGRGQISTEYNAKMCSLHLQASIPFLQGMSHRTYCMRQKTTSYLTVTPRCERTCKVNRNHCQRIRLLLILVKVTLSYQYMAQGSLLSIDLSIPALRRHQGDTDMNAIHLMESSHLHKQFPLLVTVNESNWKSVRCHLA